MSQWLTWLGDFLTLTVGTIDGTAITLGGALAIGLIAMAIGAVVSIIARIGSR